MRLSVLAAPACLAAMGLVGCGSSPGRRTRSTAAPRLARLSLKQLAGQRVIYAYPGSQPPPALLARIRHGEAAGVIFFTPNIPSAGRLRTTLHELRLANARSPVHAPLLYMVDQEGGQVRRLAGAPAESEREIGAGEGGTSRARDAGEGAAENIVGAGLNVNLAPVLDVFRRPGDFIDQYERSYSSDPARVAELGAAFISAQQQHGVAATAKHFPGLGAAEQADNTDERPVAIDIPLTSLRAVDELPYEAAIRAGVRLVMLSWAVYPALDPTLPAGFSRKVIGGELRGYLSYHGATVTDSIEAGAIGAFGGVAARAARAALAGDDLILCSGETTATNTPDIGSRALAGIASAISERVLPRTRAEASAERVLALRESGLR